MAIDNVNHMQLHIKALYVYNKNGRIAACNQFNGGLIPRFHLARTQTNSYSVFRNDVSGDVVKAIEEFVQKEPVLRDFDARPMYEDDYINLLSKQGAIESIWHGPTYRFTNRESVKDPNVVQIDTTYMGLLEQYMDDWLEDVRHRRPFFALLEGDHAVAVCASARMSPKAHEAGVETVPAYRGKGYAPRVVAAWADAVLLQNAEPIYSTSWDNHASQAVANALNLELVGTDFHIR